jgi:uncharacterized protein (DUF2236 family)
VFDVEARPVGDTEIADNDHGLFGPLSVTWQLHADPGMWIAGICSLYLQALHPLAVAGVVQNSTFRKEPLVRLLRTADYVGLVTYGPTAHVQVKARAVRELHRGLRARDPRTGRTFRVDEPDLLLYVHCAEVYSFAMVTRRAGFPMNDRHIDRYFDEQRRSAALVGLDPDEVPGSLDEMESYFDRVRPELARTADSDVIFEFLRMPPVPYMVARFGYLPIGHLAYSMLPGWAIRLHGRLATPRPLATIALQALRRAGQLVPLSAIDMIIGESSHPMRAVARLGRWATPSPRLLPRL